MLETKTAAKRKARLAVKKSGIHGYGVFTLQPLKKGQFIAELQGSRINYQTFVHGQSNRYSDWFGIGKNTWIDPVDEFQYLNHSCNPNAGLTGLRKLRLHALRNIEEGEELTIDYSTTEDDPWFGFENLEQPHEKYRQFVGPIQTLPKDIFISYLPFIPAYFRKVYEDTVLCK